MPSAAMMMGRSIAAISKIFDGIVSESVCVRFIGTSKTSQQAMWSGTSSDGTLRTKWKLSRPARATWRTKVSCCAPSPTKRNVTPRNFSAARTTLCRSWARPCVPI